jgi:hypothetical protein
VKKFIKRKKKKKKKGQSFHPNWVGGISLTYSIKVTRVPFFNNI